MQNKYIESDMIERPPLRY